MRRFPIQKIALLLILAYFLTASSLFLDRLELNNDEAIPGIGALALMRPTVPLTRLRHMDSLTMFSPHKGKVASVPEALLFFFFGSSIFLLRFTQVLFSLGTLLCVYYVCGRQFNRGVALGTVFLLAIDSSFIRATRIGNMQDAVLQVFLFWLGLALVQAYLDKGKKYFLYACGYIWGVALWAKLMALGYFIGMMAASIVLRRRADAYFSRRIFTRKGDLPVFIAAFLLGCAPLILYNVLGHWMTLKHLLASFSRFPTNAGVWNNMDFPHNLALRLGNFYDLLRGQGNDMMSAPLNEVHPAFFLISLVFVVSYLLFAREKETFPKRKIAFLSVLYGTLLCLSAFLPAGGSVDPHHLIVLLPMIQIVEAIFLGLVYAYLRNKAVAFAIILLFIYPHAVSEVGIMKWIVRDLAREEHVACASAQRAVTRYLEQNGVREVFCLDETPMQNIDFISGLKVATWGFGAKGGFWTHPLYGLNRLPSYLQVSVESMYEYRLKKRHSFYVLMDRNDRDSVALFSRLEQAVRRDARSVVLAETFIGNAGIRRYELYRVEGPQDLPQAH